MKRLIIALLVFTIGGCVKAKIKNKECVLVDKAEFKINDQTIEFRIEGCDGEIKNWKAQVKNKVKNKGVYL